MTALPSEFLALSRRVGADPLLVQGPGGNTSVTSDGVMWIKASGTELADAETSEIFVAVDPTRALAELDGAGDGTCRSAMVDDTARLRPSIETTFHALLPQRFVVHVHSVATICHAIADEGLTLLEAKLAGLAWVCVPYRKPGIPLTAAIREAAGATAPAVIVLENHGLIVAADCVAEIERLLATVEERLALAPRDVARPPASPIAIEGRQALPELGALTCDPSLRRCATSGSYYPDHVVFLGPGLPLYESGSDDIGTDTSPAILVEGEGVYLRDGATSAQRAMVRCLFDVLIRTPEHWNLRAIGPDDEAALLDWDAEKYRQALAARGR
ncbi:MAG: class II aldolase/adducin family protein [Pseudomonadota bacterium]